MSHAAQSGQGYRALDPRSGRLTTAWASLSKVGVALLLGLPGALTVYFAFNSGGMFEVTTAFGALVVLVAMVVGATLAREPLAGLAPRGLLACGSPALFALWTLLSARWSHATGRALIAFITGTLELLRGYRKDEHLRGAIAEAARAEAHEDDPLQTRMLISAHARDVYGVADAFA
jgi:hypothetical protein